jgi:hypothetical protein
MKIPVSTRFQPHAFRLIKKVFTLYCQCMGERIRAVSLSVQKILSGIKPTLSRFFRHLRQRRLSAAKRTAAAVKKLPSSGQEFLKSRALFICVLAVAAVSSLFAFLCTLCPSPPLKTIAQSRIALHGARQIRGEIFAPDLFRTAERQWETALSEWRHQNHKWFLARDYQKLYRLAVETRDIALRCKEKSAQTGDSLKTKTLAETAVIEKKIKHFESQVQALPIPESLRKSFVRAELMVLESKSASARQDFVRSAALLKSARTLLDQTGREVTGRFRSYLSNVSDWQRLAEETIAWSRENRDAAIVVDKMAHQCRIYQEGNLIAEFPVELGANWMGHKKMRGDRATPEGRYTVMGKKGDWDTPYHKALEINYPNEEDILRFEEDLKIGRLPFGTDIGGSIQIHGGGGRETDWTNGCIALKNGDMDLVFEWARIGTPVVIIGSLNSEAPPVRF